MNLNATIFGQIISFILFTFFCMKYVWTPLISIIEKRQKIISDNLTAAQKSKIESERIHSEAVICLQQARIKSQEIVQKASQYKVNIINEAKITAQKEYKKILSKAHIQIEQEKKRMRNELQNTIGQLIIQGTEKIIEHSINEIIDQSIVNNIINNTLLSYKE